MHSWLRNLACLFARSRRQTAISTKEATTNEKRAREEKKAVSRRLTVRVLGRLTRKNNRATLNQLHIMSDLKVSRRTIRRRLKEMGLNSRVARKKPFMSAVHRAKRLAFARKHLKWTLQQWKKVLFTDESTFEIGLNPRRVLVWRRRHERDLPANLVPTFKSGRTTQMVWGGIMHGCKTDLAIFEKCGRNERKTISDADSYVNQVYKGPLTRFLRGKRGVVLMEDGAPIHRSNAPKIWRQKRRLKKLDWPPSSPDLNPIENLWYLMKVKVNCRFREGMTLDDLREDLLEVWNAFDSEYYNRLIESMPQRMRAVIAAKGGPTRW